MSGRVVDYETLGVLAVETLSERTSLDILVFVYPDQS